MAAKIKQAEGSGEEKEEKDMLRVGLGEALREFRKEGEAKLSQGELSIQAGLPWNAVGDLERGERTIKGDELKNICKVLGVPLKVFMARVTKKQLEALGEPEASAAADEAPSTRLPDLYLTMALGGGKVEDVIETVRRMILAGAPPRPEEE